MRRSGRIFRRILAPHPDHRVTAKRDTRITWRWLFVRRKDFSGANVQINRIDQIQCRHLHEIRVGDIVITVGISEALRVYKSPNACERFGRIRWQQAVVKPRNRILSNAARARRRR